VLGRGERLELLVEKTDSLGQQAFAFKRQVRRHARGPSKLFELSLQQLLRGCCASQ
jgi:hypothetical protein